MDFFVIICPLNIPISFIWSYFSLEFYINFGLCNLQQYIEYFNISIYIFLSWKCTLKKHLLNQSHYKSSEALRKWKSPYIWKKKLLDGRPTNHRPSYSQSPPPPIPTNPTRDKLKECFIFSKDSFERAGAGGKSGFKILGMLISSCGRQNVRMCEFWPVYVLWESLNFFELKSSSQLAESSSEFYINFELSYRWMRTWMLDIFIYKQNYLK